MNRYFATLILCMLAPSTALAQQPIGPHSDDTLALATVPKAQLDAALSARQNCQALIRLLNEVGARWQDLSVDLLSENEFLDIRRAAKIEWDIRWGACAGARRDLSDGMPRLVLDAEVEHLKGMWQGLDKVCEALRDHLGTTRVNQSAATYTQTLQQWNLALPSRARFWSGPDATATGSVESCVQQTERAQHHLAVELMRAASADRLLSTDESIDALRIQLEQADRSRRECSSQSPAEQVELQLLGRLMRSHRRLFDGLVDGDDPIVRESMITAQEAFSRLHRCRNEHASGGVISETCASN